MSLQWFDFVGMAGIVFVLVAYFLLQAGKLHGASIGYQLANLFGAVFGFYPVSADGLIKA